MRTMDSNYFTKLEQFIDHYMDVYDRSPSDQEIAVRTDRVVSTVLKHLSQALQFC